MITQLLWCDAEGKLTNHVSSVDSSGQIIFTCPTELSSIQTGLNVATADDQMVTFWMNAYNVQHGVNPGTYMGVRYG